MLRNDPVSKGWLSWNETFANEASARAAELVNQQYDAAIAELKTEAAAVSPHADVLRGLLKQVKEVPDDALQAFRVVVTLHTAASPAYAWLSSPAGVGDPLRFSFEQRKLPGEAAQVRRRAPTCDTCYRGSHAPLTPQPFRLPFRTHATCAGGRVPPRVHPDVHDHQGCCRRQDDVRGRRDGQRWGRDG